MACRTERQKRDLVRVVRTPSGAVALDPGGRMPGRGAYLCCDEACWTEALRKGALQRALGVQLPPDLREQLGVGPLQLTQGGTIGT